MTLTAFYNEEQVEVGEDKLTLVLDFRSIDVCEGLCGRPMPEIVAELRSGRPMLSVAGKVLWAMLRERHEQISLNEAAGLMFGDKAAEIGFKLDALLERAFPLEEAAKKPANPRKRRGASKPS